MVPLMAPQSRGGEFERNVSNLMAISPELDPLLISAFLGQMAQEHVRYLDPLKAYVVTRAEPCSSV